MSEETNETVEIRPGEHEAMSEALLERCDGNSETAGFFHSLGAAIGGKAVDNKYLRSNTPDLKSD